MPQEKDVNRMGHNDAFTGGVKPGGLTSTMEVRILLCYLIKTAAKTAAPLTRQELENALLSEELVNYFELAGGLGDLEQQGDDPAGGRPLPGDRQGLHRGGHPGLRSAPQCAGKRGPGGNPGPDLAAQGGPAQGHRHR